MTKRRRQYSCSELLAIATDTVAALRDAYLLIGKAVEGKALDFEALERYFANVTSSMDSAGYMGMLLPNALAETAETLEEMDGQS